MTKEQIKEIEEVVGDTIMEYRENNPIEERFNAPELVQEFVYNFGAYFAAAQFVVWIPFQVWRKTNPNEYKKLVNICKKSDIDIPEAILDLILEKVFELFRKWLPKEIE